MLIRKIWTGTMAAVAVVAMTSLTSIATAALPEGAVNTALDKSKTLAQQQAEVRALALAHAGNPADFTQLVQEVMAGITQEQAAGFAGALAAACNASGDNPGTTAILVSNSVNPYPEAGGAIVGQVITNGCSAEVAANTLQQALLTAAGQSLRRRLVLKNPGPGTGVDVGSEAFVKSENTTRLGNREGTPPFILIQETPQSPTKVKDKGPELPEQD